MDECWQDLCNAVVLQAVNDYRRAERVLKRYPRHKPAMEVKAELEAFFLSDWCETLCSIEGKVLLEKLEKEGSK